MPEVIRILCVDDEVNILNVIRRQLCDLDVELHLARSAEEGLTFLRQTQPVHVVLSDYLLSGMNGIDFLKSVFNEWPATSGILLSGLVGLDTVHEELELINLYAFLHKPWKTKELQKAVLYAAAQSFVSVATSRDKLKVNKHEQA